MPSLLVTVGVFTAVATLVTVTVAPGSRPPELSTIRPEMLPRGSWARAGALSSRVVTRVQTKARKALIDVLPTDCSGLKRLHHFNAKVIDSEQVRRTPGSGGPGFGFRVPGSRTEPRNPRIVRFQNRPIMLQ